MRSSGRTDSNQPEIVSALRKCGCKVQSLASIGKGCPDLLVGVNGVNYLLEVKDGEKVPSARKLTTAEHEWHLAWKGQVAIVETTEEALTAVGKIRKGGK